jgi:hypothetical protein
MNVSEIRQRIFDQMDYSPDLQVYKDSVVRRMNDHYQRICDAAHWLFLQKESTIQVRKKVSNDGGSVSATNTLFFQVNSSNLREILAATTGTYYSGSPPAASSTLVFTKEMEGQTLIDEDGNEYRIVAVKSSTIMYIDSSWQKSTAADITDFTIRFDRYALPEDCIEVLGFVDRTEDRGRLTFVDRRREENAYLDRDSSGDVVTIVEDESIIDQSPINTPTAADNSTSGGTLVSAHKYEYRYTILREGRESPPSMPIEHTLGSGVTKVDLANIDDTQWFSGSNSYASGIIKLIYRRDITNEGRWLLITALPSGTTTYTDTTLNPTGSFTYLQSVGYKFSNQRDIKKWLDPGPIQYIRMWHTPDQDQKIHIRYHWRPATLQADTDAPVWPRQYHHLLVYLTLEDMFMQMQATEQAQVFRGRGEHMIQAMRRRYLARDDTRKRFMRWDRPRRYRVIGPVTTTFGGA